MLYIDLVKKYVKKRRTSDEAKKKTQRTGARTTSGGYFSGLRLRKTQVNKLFFFPQQILTKLMLKDIENVYTSAKNSQVDANTGLGEDRVNIVNIIGNSRHNQADCQNELDLGKTLKNMTQFQ